MRKLALALAAIAALSTAAPAAASVTLLVNGSGQLTGATGVTINGATYNVSFGDGTCPSLFGGCDANSDFTFTTLSDAQAAALALLNQVLIDGPDGQFDTDYAKTLGCATNDGLTCDVLIPYALDGAGFDAGVAQNKSTIDSASLAINVKSTSTFDTSDSASFTFARFTLVSAAVPEPATWEMMLLGFAGIGCAVRRRATEAPARFA
jgi:opacity protein-like surface antigen